MTQSDLAAATGLSLRTVGNYERGRTPESAPIVPDGYYDVARALCWTHASIDQVLEGGEPDISTDAQERQQAVDLTEVTLPAMQLADAARDMGAPPALVDSYRMAAIHLVGWMAAQSDAQPTTVGRGVAPEDAERLLQLLEDDK
jgi:transcriptional regulator with XRE-family HTH domain